jgi:anti-anti-sigma factor
MEVVWMKIDQEHYEEMTMVVPHDSLVGDDASQLGEALALALSENPRDVAVDVSRVSQIDSRGLEVLADTTEQLIRSGRALKLVAADETLREILELTELASLFEYSDSVELVPEGI